MLPGLLVQGRHQVCSGVQVLLRLIALEVTQHPHEAVDLQWMYEAVTWCFPVP